MSKDKEEKEKLKKLELNNQIARFIRLFFHNTNYTSQSKTEFEVLDLAHNFEIFDIIKKIENRGLFSIGLSFISDKEALVESFLDKLLSDKYKEALMMVDIKELNKDIREIKLPYLSSMIYELSKKASTSKDKSSKKTSPLSEKACSHISELTKELLLVITSDESIFKLFVENFSIDKIREDDGKSIASKILSQLLQPALIDVLCSKEFHQFLEKYLLNKEFISSTLNLIPELKSTLAELLGIDQTQLSEQLDTILPALLPLAQELFKDPNILKIVLTNFKEKLSPETQLANQGFKDSLLKIILSKNFLDIVEKNMSNIMYLVSISPKLQATICDFLGIEDKSNDIIPDLLKLTQTFLILIKNPTILDQLKDILEKRNFSLSFEEDLKNNPQLRESIYKLLENKDFSDLILKTDIEFLKKLINSSPKVQSLIKSALGIDEDADFDFSVITELLSQFPNQAGLILGISQKGRVSGEFEKILAQRKIREEALKIIENDTAIFAKLTNPDFEDYISTIDPKVLEELKLIDTEFNDPAFQLRSGYTLLITIENIKELMLLIDPLNKSADSLLYLLKLSPKLQDLIAKELFSDREKVKDLIESNSQAILDLLEFLSDPTIKNIIESSLEKLEKNEPLDINDLKALLTNPQLAEIICKIDIDSISNLISNSEYLTHIIVSQLRIYDEYRSDYVKDLLAQTKVMLPALQKLISNKEVVSEIFSIIHKYQTTQTVDVIQIINLLSQKELQDVVKSIDPDLMTKLLKSSKFVTEAITKNLGCDKKTAHEIISFMAHDGLDYIKAIQNDASLLEKIKNKFLYHKDINPIDILMYRPSIVIDIISHDSLQKLPLDKILPTILNTKKVSKSICEKLGIEEAKFPELVSKYSKNISEVIKRLSASGTMQELLKLTEEYELNTAILEFLKNKKDLEIIEFIQKNDIDTLKEDPNIKVFIQSYPKAIEVIKKLDLKQDIEKQLTLDQAKIFDILTAPEILDELEKLEPKEIVDFILSSNKIKNYLANTLKLDVENVEEFLLKSLNEHYKKYIKLLKDDKIRENIRNIIVEFDENKSLIEMMQNEKFFDSIISLVTNKELLENLVNVNHEALDIILNDLSETFAKNKNNIVPNHSSDDKKRSKDSTKHKSSENNQDLSNKSIADIVSKSSLAQRLTKYGFSQNFTKKIVTKLTKTRAFDLKRLVVSIDNIMNKKRKFKLAYILDIINIFGLSMKVFGGVDTLKLFVVGLRNLANKLQKKVNLFDVSKEVGKNLTSKKKKEVTESELGNLKPPATPLSSKNKDAKDKSRS